LMSFLVFILGMWWFDIVVLTIKYLLLKPLCTYKQIKMRLNSPVRCHEGAFVAALGRDSVRGNVRTNERYNVRPFSRSGVRVIIQ
jgi:hypothetical protein